MIEIERSNGLDPVKKLTGDIAATAQELLGNPDSYDSSCRTNLALLRKLIAGLDPDAHRLSARQSALLSEASDGASRVLSDLSEMERAESEIATNGYHPAVNRRISTHGASAEDQMEALEQTLKRIVTEFGGTAQDAAATQEAAAEKCYYGLRNYSYSKPEQIIRLFFEDPENFGIVQVESDNSSTVYSISYKGERVFDYVLAKSNGEQDFESYPDDVNKELFRKLRFIPDGPDYGRL